MPVHWVTGSVLPALTPRVEASELWSKIGATCLGLIMAQSRRAVCTLAAVIGLVVAAGMAASAQREGEARKPSLSLKATPPVGFSPLRVRLVVDVRGGADDYQEFYCPGIEWEWGDGTLSESSEDCEPYEAGKSTIRRRFSTEHVFRQGGSYQVFFRLKQRSRVIAATSAQVQVRAGVRDGFDD